MTPTTLRPKVLAPGEGLRLQSGPGRDLVFKVTGEDTGGAFDYFVGEVAPRSGPPLHLHGVQEEAIHVLKGRRIRIGDDTFTCEEGAFAFYTPGGGHHFHEELGPLTRNGMPDRETVAALFEKYDMTLLGPPLAAE
jgi:hypothetical protein